MPFVVAFQKLLACMVTDVELAVKSECKLAFL